MVRLSKSKVRLYVLWTSGSCTCLHTKPKAASYTILDIEEEEEFYKLLPANKADHLCQLWQSCSDLHKIQTVYDIVENPHSIRLSKK